MLRVELYYQSRTICPMCEAQLYQEIWEDESKVYLVCERSGCDYQAIVKYEYIKFSFTYRDEFTTEVIAKNIEEALGKIDDATWKRTGYNLWKDYLDARYYPVFELHQCYNGRGCLNPRGDVNLKNAN